MEEEWSRHEKLLKESVQTTKKMTSTKMRVRDLIIRVTGLEPEKKAFQLLDQASTAIFIPCLQLGELLSIFVIEDICYVLFDPMLQGEMNQPESMYVVPSNQKIEQTDMVSQLEVIGDKTRINILQLLTKQPGMDTGQISEALGVHASTISRHCQQLEKNRIIAMAKVNNHKHYNLNQDQIRQIARWLMESFGSSEDIYKA